MDRKMMNQLQQMQKKMMQAQEELGSAEVDCDTPSVRPSASRTGDGERDRATGPRTRICLPASASAT